MTKNERIERLEAQVAEIHRNMKLDKVTVDFLDDEIEALYKYFGLKVECLPSQVVARAKKASKKG